MREIIVMDESEGSVNEGESGYIMYGCGMVRCVCVCVFC
jgi:hypothetical protein